MATNLRLSKDKRNVTKICQCTWNCGEITNPSRNYIIGHANRTPIIKRFCERGCGETISRRAE
jgi:hypothetical protein